MSLERLKTVYFLGSLIKNIKGIYDKVNQIVDYINNDVKNYSVYKARLSHSGTPNDIPETVDFDGNSSTAITDEIGGVWSYDSTGLYIYTKEGLCADLDKIDVLITDNLGIPYKILWGKNDTNSIYLETRKITDFTTSPVSFSAMNGILYITPIEIRLYN